jgi:hypothetical protein
LTWGSAWVADRLLKCNLRLDLDYGSDHFLLETEISLKATLAPIKERRK